LYYWIIAAAYLFIQDWADIILFWIPFYNELKLFFVILITQTQFSQFLFLSYLQPYLLSKEKDVDNTLDLFRGLMKSMAFNLGVKLYNSSKHTVINFITKNSTLGLPNVALLTTVMAQSSIENSLFGRGNNSMEVGYLIQNRADTQEDKSDRLEPERERLEKERLEKERIECLERARLEIECLEREKKEKERLEIELLEREKEKGKNRTIRQRKIRKGTSRKFRKI